MTKYDYYVRQVMNFINEAFLRTYHSGIFLGRKKISANHEDAVEIMKC